jgi:hypothetical protein
MLCDEFGHLVISTISRDDFRAVLPKVAAGVDAVTLLGEKSKDVSMVTSYWFQRADSGEPSFVEVSEKVEKSIQAALPRASELEMVLPKSSCDHFLKEYVKNVHFSFDSDASRHELQFVVSELKKLRGDQKKGYPIFISSLDVVGQDFSKHWSLALKVHLKQLLELACLKLYRRKK